MNFERGKDPKATLGIGLRQKRVFKDIEEAAHWAAQWPGEYTNGFIEDWTASNPYNDQPFFNMASNRIDGNGVEDPTRKYSEGIGEGMNLYYGKLYIVKWFKENIHLEPYTQEILGLKECKLIADRMEQIIAARLLLNASYGLR